MNKRAIKCIAALFILVFHLWIVVTPSKLELFLVKIGYVGVDLFFLASAYSLADKEIEYTSFVKERFLAIYPRFAFFVVISALWNHWSLMRIIKILSFYELFERGGGAFLWFLPAIMLFYLLIPFYTAWECPYKELVVLAIWLFASICLERFTGYSKIFIFTNRIPVMLMGYTMKKYDIPKWGSIFCLFVGMVLLYYLGFTKKLHIPFSGFYLVLASVFVVGLAGVSLSIPERKWMKWISDATLELYAVQMILGAELVTYIYRLLENALLTNIVVLCVISGLAIMVRQLYNARRRRIGCNIS